MISRTDGATIDKIVAAISWQLHRSGGRCCRSGFSRRTFPSLVPRGEHRLSLK
jgi:hypothetical protein